MVQSSPALYIIIMLFYSWILTIVALLVAPVLGLLTFLYPQLFVLNSK